MSGAMTHRLGAFNHAPAGNPYGFVSVGTANSTFGGTALTPSYPTGLLVGDILIAYISGSLASGVETITTPGGWTRFVDVNIAGGNIFAIWKRADGTESGTLSISHNGSVTNDQWDAVMIAYGGCVGTGSPIDDIQTGSGTSNPVTFPSVSLSVANEMKINFCGADAVVTFGTPTGFAVETTVYTIHRTPMAVFDKTFASSGATGTQTCNRSSSGRWNAASFGLIPA